MFRAWKSKRNVQLTEHKNYINYLQTKNSEIKHTGTQVPTRISAPAAARDFAIAHPYPLSSAMPAMKALFPAGNSSYGKLIHQDANNYSRLVKYKKFRFKT